MNFDLEKVIEELVNSTVEEDEKEHIFKTDAPVVASHDDVVFEEVVVDVIIDIDENVAEECLPDVIVPVVVEEPEVIVPVVVEEVIVPVVVEEPEVVVHVVVEEPEVIVPVVVEEVVVPVVVEEPEVIVPVVVAATEVQQTERPSRKKNAFFNFMSSFFKSSR